MRYVIVLASLIMLVVVSGCYPRAEVDFATDVRILRGPWQGTLDTESDSGGVELRFDLEAAYGTRTHYPFWGQVWFGDEGPFAIEGFAYGRQTEVYVQSTVIPAPRIAGFIAEIPERSLRICGNGAADIRRYYGWAFEEGAEGLVSVCAGCQSYDCESLAPRQNFTMRRIDPLPLGRAP